VDFKELNQTRRSHRDYDPAIKIGRETLDRILNQAALAPSCFNMQGYRVIAVLSEEEKKRLYPLAMNQPQVLTASAMLIVCGNLAAYKGLRYILEQTPGIPAQAIQSMVSAAYGSHEDDLQAARDEAIRTVGLFAMNLMHVALNEGYETGPMIGFDAAAVAKAYNIQHPYFPALMISLGKAKALPYPRGYRVPADEFTTYF
jgi:nitroreductase